MDGNARQNRTVNVKVRLTEDEHEYLQYRQKMCGARSLSEYIRFAAINKEMTIIDRNALKQFLVDIAAVRSSLNQIAKRLNATNQFYGDDRKTIEDAMQEMNEIWQSLSTMLLKQP